MLVCFSAPGFTATLTGNYRQSSQTPISMPAFPGIGTSQRFSGSVFQQVTPSGPDANLYWFLIPDGSPIPMDPGITIVGNSGSTAPASQSTSKTLGTSSTIVTFTANPPSGPPAKRWTLWGILIWVAAAVGNTQNVNITSVTVGVYNTVTGMAGPGFTYAAAWSGITAGNAAALVIVPTGWTAFINPTGTAYSYSQLEAILPGEFTMEPNLGIWLSVTGTATTSPQAVTLNVLPLGVEEPL